MNQLVNRCPKKLNFKISEKYMEIPTRKADLYIRDALSDLVPFVQFKKCD